MDQVVPALIYRTCHCRMRKNMRELMSKWNYIISVREPIGGDTSTPRTCAGYPYLCYCLRGGDRKLVP